MALLLAKGDRLASGRCTCDCVKCLFGVFSVKRLTFRHCFDPTMNVYFQILTGYVYAHWPFSGQGHCEV